MTMRALTEGCRAMALTAAAAYDAAHAHPDADVRKQNQAFYEFLVPLVKGYSSEMSLEVTNLGVLFAAKDLTREELAAELVS